MKMTKLYAKVIKSILLLMVFGEFAIPRIAATHYEILWTSGVSPTPIPPATKFEVGDSLDFINPQEFAIFKVPTRSFSSCVKSIDVPGAEYLRSDRLITNNLDEAGSFVFFSPRGDNGDCAVLPFKIVVVDIVNQRTSKFASDDQVRSIDE